MPTVKLHEKHHKSLIQAFEFSSNLKNKSSNEFSWQGVKSVISTDLVTDPLNDYDRTGSSNRYGTPSEVADNQQIMTLQWDKSFSKTVDKGNYKEGGELKTGAAVTKAYMNEQVGPLMEKLVYEEWARNAGIVEGTNAPTKSTIVDQLLKIETKMDDERVPKNARFVAMKNEYIAMFRSSMMNLDGITDRLLLKGVVGRIGSLLIIGASSHDMPANVHMLAWQKQAVLNPKTIVDTKVSYDTQGISGMLVEGRYRFGAFVVGKRASGVYTVCASAAKTANPTITTASNSTTLACTTSGATIYYTTDGSDPRYSVTRKTGTTVTGKESGVKVKAFAIADGFYGSDVVIES